MKYTDEQSSIIHAPLQHTKVVAVAGAGKTSTLIEMLVNKLEQGADPKRILVLMYNKSAQVDFQTKLTKRAPHLTLPQVRTFHSLGLKIYQKLVQIGHCAAKNWHPMPRFMEEQLALKALLASISDQAEQRELRSDPAESIEIFLSMVELFKSGFDDLDIVFEELTIDKKYRYFISAFDLFEQYRIEQNAITFSDMLYEPTRLLRKNKELRNYFANHMDLIMVDEYQDINAVQNTLLESLSGDRAKVVAIGDPDQTIYEFRGSKPEFILSRFDQQFAGTHSLPLTRTFRYGYPLALHANLLIDNNQQRIAQVTVPFHQEHKTSLDLLHTDTEAAQVKSHITALYDQGFSLSDTVVLCRLWANAAEIELTLLRSGIPFELRGGVSVLDRRDLDVLKGLLEVGSQGAHRQIIAEPIFWRKLMMTPHLKIKQPIIDQVSQLLATTKRGFKQTIMQNISQLNGWEKKQLAAFADRIYEVERRGLPAYQALNRYANQSDLFNGIMQNGASKSKAEETVQSFTAFLAYLRTINCSPSAALDHLSQLKDSSKTQQTDRVCITTIHRAKGLEWKHVIIPSFNASNFPYLHDHQNKDQSVIESERRLLYVGITRAKESCLLVGPSSTSSNSRSRFETELGLEHKNSWQRALDSGKLVAKPKRSQHKVFAQLANIHQLSEVKLDVNEQAGQLKNGLQLTHKNFGRGTVVNVDPNYLTADFNGDTRTFSMAHITDQFEEEFEI